MTKGREHKVVIEKKTIAPLSLVREYVSILKLKHQTYDNGSRHMYM